MDAQPRKLDKYEQFVQDCIPKCSAMLLGNPDLTSFEFCEITGGISVEMQQKILDRSLNFIGLFGIMRDGKTGVTLHERAADMNHDTLMKLARVFAERVIARLDGYEDRCLMRMFVSDAN